MKKSLEKSSEEVTYSPSKRVQGNNIIWLAPLGVILLCGLSFFAGTGYEKGHVKSTSASATATGGFGNRTGGRSGRFAGQRPNIGDVTAISPTSITIQDSFDNSTKTFSITSTTTVTNGSQTGAISDIQTGQRALVRTSSTTSTQATAIDINPSFGGGQGGNSGTTNPDSSGNSPSVD
jgi:hypothetical protein